MGAESKVNPNEVLKSGEASSDEPFDDHDDCEYLQLIRLGSSSIHEGVPWNEFERTESDEAPDILFSDIQRTDSSESQPGAFAIMGPDCPELRRQQRISDPVSDPVTRVSPEEPMVLAVIVDDDVEQPSLVFDASPLVDKGSWKWITAVSFLILLLSLAVAVVFIQAARKVGPDQSSSKQDQVEIVDNKGSGQAVRPVEVTSAPTIAPSMSTTIIPTADFHNDPSFVPPETYSEMPSGAMSLTHTKTPSLIPENVPSSFPSISTPSWTQVGKTISGDHQGASLGKSLALSQDGNFLAIGSHRYDFGSELATGLVRIYQLTGNDSWQQIGQDMIGSAAGDEAGCAIGLSADGSIVAIGSWSAGKNKEGSVRVYEYDRSNNAWSQLGQTMFGGEDGIFFGGFLSLSDDGLTVAIGATMDDGSALDAGRVQVFSFNRLLGYWYQFGQTFYGQGPDDQAGSAVSVSGNANFVALGVPLKDDIFANSGLVRVYKVHPSGLGWTSLGSSLFGTDNEQGFGLSVGLSSDGMTLAVSSRNDVYIFKFDSNVNDWVQINTGISFQPSSTTDTSSETHVVLSPDGRTVAVSRRSGSSPAWVQVYDLDEQTGLGLPVGQIIRDHKGEGNATLSVFLPSNRLLGVGFPNHVKNGELNAGAVEIYRLSDSR